MDATVAHLRTTEHKFLFMIKSDMLMKFAKLIKLQAEENLFYNRVYVKTFQKCIKNSYLAKLLNHQTNF